MYGNKSIRWCKLFFSIFPIVLFSVSNIARLSHLNILCQLFDKLLKNTLKWSSCLHIPTLLYFYYLTLYYAHCWQILWHHTKQITTINAKNTIIKIYSMTPFIFCSTGQTPRTVGLMSWCVVRRPTSVFLSVR